MFKCKINLRLEFLSNTQYKPYLYAWKEMKSNILELETIRDRLQQSIVENKCCNLEIVYSIDKYPYTKL